MKHNEARPTGPLPGEPNQRIDTRDWCLYIGTGVPAVFQVVSAHRALPGPYLYVPFSDLNRLHETRPESGSRPEVHLGETRLETEEQTLVPVWDGCRLYGIVATADGLLPDPHVVREIGRVVGVGDTTEEQASDPPASLVTNLLASGRSFEDVVRGALAWYARFIPGSFCAVYVESEKRLIKRFAAGDIFTSDRLPAELDGDTLERWNHGSAFQQSFIAAETLPGEPHFFDRFPAFIYVHRIFGAYDPVCWFALSVPEPFPVERAAVLRETVGLLTQIDPGRFRGDGELSRITERLSALVRAGCSREEFLCSLYRLINAQFPLRWVAVVRADDRDTLIAAETAGEVTASRAMGMMVGEAAVRTALDSGEAFVTSSVQPGEPTSPARAASDIGAALLIKVVFSGHAAGVVAFGSDGNGEHLLASRPLLLLVSRFVEMHQFMAAARGADDQSAPSASTVSDGGGESRS